jgi:alcohol dehydrogenase class IV
MVNDFNILRTPRIIFGNGRISRLPEIIEGIGNNLLILTGKESFMRVKKAALLFEDLDRRKVKYKIESVTGEPSPDVVDNLVSKYGDSVVRLVVAIGGGSVIDTGKAVSAMLPLKQPVKEYLEGVGTLIHPGIKIPFVAVPTTAGTGSETTANAVLSLSGKNGFKRSLRHENFVPDIALVDPELTHSCSPAQTAVCGMDAFTQLLESFLSTRNNWYIDALALEGMMHIKKALRTAAVKGNDHEARASMSYAAMLSGITLANAGLGLVHGFASSIGSFREIPHGVICGTMMGVVNRAIVERLLKSSTSALALDKYIQLGKLLSEADGRSDVDYAFFVANYIELLVEELKIPLLGGYGLKEADITAIAASTDHKNNPVIFSTEELGEMVRKRI